MNLGSTEKAELDPKLVDISRDQENLQRATPAGDQARGNLQITSNGPAHSASEKQPSLEHTEERSSEPPKQVQQPRPGDAEKAHIESSHNSIACQRSGDNHTPPEDPHDSRQNALEVQSPKSTSEVKRTSEVASEIKAFSEVKAASQDKADDIERAHELSPWPPFVMISCFLLGLVASISHHLFYSHLNDTIAYENLQQWNLRSACYVITA